MAGVVDDGHQRLIPLAGDPRDQECVVRRSVRVVPAHVLLQSVVPQIPISSQRAAAEAVGDRGRLRPGPGRGDQIAHRRRNRLQIAADQLSPGQGLSFQAHQTCSVGMGEHHQEGVTADPGVPAGPLQQQVHLGGPQQDVVQQDQDLLAPRSRSGLLKVPKSNGRRRQGAMHARGAIVAGRAPHPVIDADRRSEIRLRQAEAATALKRPDRPRVFSNAFHNGDSLPQLRTDWLSESGFAMTLAAVLQAPGSNWGTSICSPFRSAD